MRLIVLAVALFALAFPAAAEDAAPRVLSPDDAALYAEILELQADGRWREADAVIARVSDPVLMGYVKMERLLHPTAYRARYEELREWMAYYADHPEADKIYSLALKRRPKAASPPLAPVRRKWRSELSPPLHPDLERDYARTSRPRLTQIEGRVRHLAGKEQASLALKEIDGHLKRGVITERQYDRMRSWIAASLYYQGYQARARDLADAVAGRSGDSAVLAYWISGLIHYRENDISAAHERFMAMARVKEQDDALRAAAGFWAARSALAAGRPEQVAEGLEIAAAYPLTFYGQLALAQLGRRYDFNWETPPVGPEAFARLTAAEPAIRRAVALVEAGRVNEGDLEFRWINGRIDDRHAADLLALEHALGLPAAQLDLALSFGGRAFEAGLFPLPAYEPENGFTADPALLYALMRQESKFKIEATSRVGARGLLQLMPRTASYMAKDKSLQRGKGRDKLYDPAVNLAIGQDYVNHLIETAADGDLFDMAVAYNGGPGNLRRWKREVPIEDPLLFIESIPNPESRDFVEKVLTNYWIYRQRLGLAPTSRDRVAAGEVPLYDALDEISAATAGGK
ncbi:MAG TPA: transglycosylase [Parvularcula sp.]|nr:transglycosylase [Parvularcula sp.]